MGSRAVVKIDGDSQRLVASLSVCFVLIKCFIHSNRNLSGFSKLQTGHRRTDSGSGTCIEKCREIETNE